MCRLKVANGMDDGATELLLLVMHEEEVRICIDNLTETIIIKAAQLFKDCSGQSCFSEFYR